MSMVSTTQAKLTRTTHDHRDQTIDNPGSPALGSAPNKPVVLILREELLPLSETFVVSAAQSLLDYQPVFVGLNRRKGLNLDGFEVFTVSDGSIAGKIRKYAWLCGFLSPRLVQSLRALKPVLIHAHFEGGGILAYYLGRKLGIPVITTFHGADVTKSLELQYPHPLALIARARGRRLLALSQSPVIAVSDFIRQAAIKCGYSAQAIRTNYLGVNLKNWAYSSEKRRSDEILFVGRLVEKKGAEDLVRAMALLQKSHPHARAVIIGQGPLLEALKNLAGQLLAPVEFRGARPHTEVRQAMQTATCLAVPSKTAEDGDSEGLPTVVTEAQAIGLPILATRHAGIPEAISDGESGWLVPENEPEAIAAALILILDDPAERARRARRSRDVVMRDFNQEAQTRRLESIYGEIVREHSSKAST